MTLEDIAVSLETLAAELRALKAPEQPWLVEVVVQSKLTPAGLTAPAAEAQPRTSRGATRLRSAV